MVIADNLYDTAALSHPRRPLCGNHFPSQEWIAGQTASGPSSLLACFPVGFCSLLGTEGLQDLGSFC